MTYCFKGKTALITGASRGIGKEILIALANEGCNVILHYYKKNNETIKLINKLKENKINIKAYSANLTIENQVAGLFKKISNEYKSLDILVNNVGNYLKTRLDNLKIKDWHAIINSNLNLTFYCTYYALPLLRKSNFGRIINIGYASSGQIVAKPQILPYQIAKTGILLLTKAYALNEAKNKILINMLSPGVMKNSVAFPKKEIPLKKRGDLKDFANLVIKTIESDYMTGAHIEYAGGFNL